MLSSDFLFGWVGLCGWAIVFGVFLESFCFFCVWFGFLFRFLDAAPQGFHGFTLIRSLRSCADASYMCSDRCQMRKKPK